MVLAEHRVTPPLTPTYHPFGSGNRLPAAMARVLLYQPQGFPPNVFPPLFDSVLQPP
ncbi:MAG: hypothetical protein LGL72_00885 [Acidibrevibacterium sp.]|jgi:hypothetical protein|uniref:hypothetical protein n=1 Tax=Acidibrevibacterium fodinaquatile TaxID=1969806 RepID=UPI0023A81524|nr:hypothetical protein [Acidibrevibacterium fodinaquatile]MCA7117986.1 hypothetical protein [Acidibrevibacterium fodinaquatile]